MNDELAFLQLAMHIYISDIHALNFEIYTRKRQWLSSKLQVFAEITGIMLTCAHMIVTEKLQEAPVSVSTGTCHVIPWKWYTMSWQVLSALFSPFTSTSVLGQCTRKIWTARLRLITMRLLSATTSFIALFSIKLRSMRDSSVMWYLPSIRCVTNTLGLWGWR